jgi:adenylate cyclase
MKKLVSPLLRLILIGSLSGLSAPNCKAQTPVIDSLKRLARSSEFSSLPDTAKIRNWNSLGWKLRRYNADTSMAIVSQSIELAKRKNLTYELAESYSHMGSFHTNKEDFVTAQSYLQTSLNLYNELVINPEGRKSEDILSGKANATGNLAIVHYYSGNLQLTLEYFYDIMTIYEQVGNTDGLASVSMNMSTTYYMLADAAKSKTDKLTYLYKSKELLEKASEINKELNDSDNDMMIWGKMAATEAEFFRLEKDPGLKAAHKQKAMTYYNQVLDLSRTLGDLEREAMMLTNRAHLHYSDNELDKALPDYLIALEIFRQLNSADGMAGSLSGLGSVYSDLKKYPQAESALLEGLQISKESGMLRWQRDFTGMLSELYRTMGKHQQALDNLYLYNALRDSMFNSETKTETAKRELRYELEKKAFGDSLRFASEAEIRDLTISEQAANLRSQRIGLFGVGFVLILIGLLAYSIYRGKKRSDELLLNILPAETAEELKAKGSAEAKLIEHVTVLFTDFKGFTELASHLPASELVALIHECFSAFDKICEKYNIEKIKTIGDAYMAAGGLPSPNTTHARDVVRAAIEMRDFITNRFSNAPTHHSNTLEIRIGIHTGPVVAGIVGIKKFQYDIWGDTVNTASRMESSGEPGKVNVSESTYSLLKDEFSFEERGEIEAKGKGKMKMYFVEKQQ